MSNKPSSLRPFAFIMPFAITMPQGLCDYYVIIMLLLCDYYVTTMFVSGNYYGVGTK